MTFAQERPIFRLMIVTRFAPSPTGRLHLGHAYAALFAYEKARKAAGRFLLRLEDIDPTRCTSLFAEAIEEDLAWLGLEWEKPPRQQSEHLPDYAAALEKLKEEGLLYPCFCTRKEVSEESASFLNAPQGPEGPLYAGTCKNLTEAERAEKEKTRLPVWRLDVAAACQRTGPLRFHDEKQGWLEATPERFGDVVLARRDIQTSYHLAVTVDDALQGVTLVTRGEDLLPSTSIHVLLQKLLGYETPSYAHHRLLCDETGRRYAKRDRSVTLASLRAAGETPSTIREKIGLAKDLG